MKMSELYSIDSRKKRWIELMKPKSDTRFTFTTTFENDSELPERPLPHPYNREARILWALVKYNVMLERTHWLNDDSIPFLDIYTGTEIFAEAMGCKVHRTDDNMPFALPLINNAVEVSKIKVPELSSSKLTHLFDIADRLVTEAGDSDAILRMVDIQSPMDISALIWDKNSFYIALIEEPEAVKELATKVNQLLTSFLDEWFKRYGHEFIAHYPEYYMNTGITLSEDEVGVVNPQMFEDMFLPELKHLSNRYGGLGMHCCANSKHQWRGFKKITNLKLLNMVQPIEVITEGYSYFSEHCAQMHSWCGNGEPWTWIDTYPKDAHVVLQSVVKSKGEAIMVCEKLHEACGR